MGQEPLHDCLAWAKGQEPCESCYVCGLRRVFKEVWRVLRKDGVFFLNLGDSYNGCVDEETEALTGEGWKKWNELQEGDEILTLNPKSYSAEWGKVDRVNVHQSKRRKMFFSEGRGHSSLTTEDHRWFIKRRTTDNGGHGRNGESNGSSLLKNGDVDDIRERYKKGSVSQSILASEYGVSQATISKIITGRTWSKQSKKKEPKNGRIVVHDVVTSSELASEHYIPISSKIGNLPVVGSTSANVIREFASNKIVDIGWLRTLTQEQIDLFIEVSVMADGHRRYRKNTTDCSLGQSSKERAEVFQIACILSGRSASLRKCKTGQWYVDIRNNKWTSLKKHPNEWVEHDGIVWCPTTNNGSWLARRNGSVFFTGNSGGAGGDYNKGGLKEGQPRYGGRNVKTLKPKDMALVPQRVALALQTDGWWVRNMVVWHKPNGMPSGADDRFSNDFEHVWVLTRNQFYYFDHDPVRIPYTKPINRWGGEDVTAKGASVRDEGTGQSTYRDRRLRPDPNGRLRRCVWEITTKSCDWDYCHGCKSLFQGDERKSIKNEKRKDSKRKVRTCPNCGSKDSWVDHFAAFPPDLIDPCLLASTSEKGCCGKCGNPMVRTSSKKLKKLKKNFPDDGCLMVWNDWSPSCGCIGTKQDENGAVIRYETVPCRVLDPFAGSGTVGIVSKKLGRIFIGIDLKSEYVDVANARMRET